MLDYSWRPRDAQRWFLIHRYLSYVDIRNSSIVNELHILYTKSGKKEKKSKGKIVLKKKVSCKYGAPIDILYSKDDLQATKENALKILSTLL